jgi:hypothetical protein
MKTTGSIAVCVALVLAGAAWPAARTPQRLGPQVRRPQVVTPMGVRPEVMRPAGAQLTYDSHRCVEQAPRCPTPDNPVYVPPAEPQTYFFLWNVARVPGAGAVRWQVLYSPFLPDTFAADVSPAGAVVQTGVRAGMEDEVELDLRAIARQLGMKPFVPPSKSILHLPPVKPAPGSLNAGARSGVGVAGPAKMPESRLYVRVVPIRSVSDPTPVGRPSGLIRIVYGSVPAVTFNTPPTYSTPRPSIAVTNFKWVPWVRIDNWPHDCEPIPRDTGKSGFEVVGDALLDIWDWASTAYGDIQNAVVNAAHFILPMIPKEVLNVALQGAMMAAGLPPSIPNLDQLMNDGAGYLAESVAAEIPVPASSELAGMTVEAFKAKAQDAARQAILAGAAEARKALSGSGVKYCQQWESFPVFEVTIRDTGHDDYADVPIRVTDSAGLFKNLTFRVPLIHAGESLTIPVTLIDRARMNVRVTEHTELPEYDDRKAESNWWDSALVVPTAFSITPPGDYYCTDATHSDCWPSWNVPGFTSAKKVWLIEGGIHKDHAD